MLFKLKERYKKSFSLCFMNFTLLKTCIGPYKKGKWGERNPQSHKFKKKKRLMVPHTTVKNSNLCIDRTRQQTNMTQQINKQFN